MLPTCCTVFRAGAVLQHVALSHRPLVEVRDLRQNREHRRAVDWRVGERVVVQRELAEHRTRSERMDRRPAADAVEREVERAQIDQCMQRRDRDDRVVV
jgi:hypothetical protein